MTDGELMQQALEALTAYDGTNGVSQRKRVLSALRERLEQPKPEPSWWPAVENILNEYGLQAIDFVADFKEALALSQQEPYCYVYKENGEDFFAPPTGYFPDDATPLYKSQQPAFVQQEPMSFITPLMEQQMFDDWCPYKGNPDPRVVWAAAVDAVNGLLLAAAPQPPQRNPLTDEQIRAASLQAGMQEHYMDFHSGFIRFAKAIEATHGIKENT